MPSWFNNSSKSKNGSGGLTEQAGQVDDPEVVQEIASREMKKNLVKIHKVTSDKTRMQIAEAIAEEMDCTMSVSYVDELWAEIRDEEDFKIADRAEQEIQKQYMEYTLMKHQLWKAWQASWDNIEKVREERGETPKGFIDKTVTTVQGRLPDSMYMKQIDEVNKSIRELLGMKQNLEVHFNQQNNQFNILSSGAPQMDLVPKDHDVFTKKPEELPESSYTSIDDEEPGMKELPEHIDD